MKRRTRVDLGQKLSAKEEIVLDRKKQRWAERNIDKNPDENPFLKAIKPDQEQFGEEDERAEELRQRLNNLEFGNFPGYFNYRNKTTIQENKDDVDSKSNQTKGNPNQNSDPPLTDERLNFFKQEWFQGKDVLDIGCNRGHITYEIAKLFDPKSIVGIDIDSKIIKMADRDLHLHLEDELIGKSKERLLEKSARLKLDDEDSSEHLELPLSSYISHGPLILDQGDVKFPNNIIFMEHNYVLSRDELVTKQKPYFDVIVCLSVTKWVHLNYCDAGLKRFFKRMYRHLRPDGLLILESQPFMNYGRRKKLSDRLRTNFYRIELKPEAFDDYLLSEEVGFKRIIYQSVTDHKCAGFKRPLKVFLK